MTHFNQKNTSEVMRLESKSEEDLQLPLWSFKMLTVGKPTTMLETQLLTSPQSEKVQYNLVEWPCGQIETSS